MQSPLRTVAAPLEALMARLQLDVRSSGARAAQTYPVLSVERSERFNVTANFFCTRMARGGSEMGSSCNTCIPTRGGSIGAKRHVPEQAGGRSNAADRCTALQLQERR